MPPLFEVAVIRTAVIGANGAILEPEQLAMAPKSVMAVDANAAIVAAVKGEKDLPPDHRCKVVVRPFPGT